MKTEKELKVIILNSVKGLKKFYELNKGVDGKLHNWIEDTNYNDIENAIKTIEIEGVKKYGMQFCITEHLYISFAAW